MLEIDLASATKNIGFHNGTWQIYVPRDFANSELATDHENKELLQSALCAVSRLVYNALTTRRTILAVLALHSYY